MSGRRNLVEACARRLALAGVLVGCLALPARPDDTAERAQRVIDALRIGDVPAAVDQLMADDAASELTPRPALVHVICDRAYRCDEVCRDATPESRLALAEIITFSRVDFNLNTSLLQQPPRD